MTMRATPRPSWRDSENPPLLLANGILGASAAAVGAAAAASITGLPAFAAARVVAVVVRLPSAVAALAIEVTGVRSATGGKAAHANSAREGSTVATTARGFVSFTAGFT